MSTMNGRLVSKGYKTFTIDGAPVTGAAELRALPGDLVQADAHDVLVEILDRAPHKSIVGTLETASKTRYGFTSRNNPLYLFVPFDEAYPPFVVGSSTASPRCNVLAVVDFEVWEAGQTLPRGNCIRVLGPCTNLAAHEEALLLHACPHRWTRKWTEPLAAPTVPAKPMSRIVGTTFHVDPPGCQDIDDAISYWPNGDGTTTVRIHIADVASLLATNKWLWRAGAIGQTLYRDGAVAMPMFPPEVEAACSLLPGQERRTLTLSFQWDTLLRMATGPIQWFHEVIEVKESYTYESILDSPHASLLRHIASHFAGKDLTDPHDWIAELMLFYNREAARVLRAAGVGLLRRHAAPDAERLSMLESLAVMPLHFAYSAGETCRADDTDVTHWGLGASVYCHASSPIRRWTDCINQMNLFRLVLGATWTCPEAQPSALNALAKRSKAYERDLFFLRVLFAMTSQMRLSAVVVEVDLGKVRVWVPTWKRLLTVREPVQGWGPNPPSITELVSLKLFHDPTQRNWKRRMVIHLEGVASVAAPDPATKIDRSPSPSEDHPTLLY